MPRRKIQIFVSSTYTDLKSDRQAAVAAILKAGHIPAGMELFIAGDKSQLDTIKRWIDESDAYMLILGGRYGSIEPISGISYTELEYDYAVQQNKPLFAVVINATALEERVKSEGTSIIEMNQPSALALFREKVLSNVSSFFSDEKDIRLCVHESLADLRDNPDVKGWVSASEIEDTQALHDEIVRLKAELVRATHAAVNITKDSENVSEDDNFKDLLKLLKGIEITIPDAIAGGEPRRNLLNVFISTKDDLINGVTNSGSANDVETFLYFNIAPKLMLHGLATNEKVAGVRWRRSFVNSTGLNFLAEYERRLAKFKNKPDKPDKPAV